jgi:hypothetical protein
MNLLGKIDADVLAMAWILKQRWIKQFVANKTTSKDINSGTRLQTFQGYQQITSFFLNLV